MFIDFTPEQRELRKQVRAYFSELMTPEAREAVRGAESGTQYKNLIRQMGKDGWLAVGWPREFGGQGLSELEQLIFFEENQLAGAPLPFVTVNTVGPALMAHGSEAHKKQFLPQIAAGEIHFAIGYTEPSAGTDLAALQTSAVRDGDHYVVNGSKIYTSGAEGADYIWLAVRTDPQAPKHKGISILIVDARDPGFSYSPIHTVGNVRTNASYYDNVRVPADMLVGELNGGWKLITSQLNHERVGLAAIGVSGLGHFQRMLEWARQPGHNGQRPIDQDWVRQNMAQAYSLLEAMRLINYRMAAGLADGEPSPAFTSAAKVYSTESLIQVYRLMLEVLGSAGLIRRGSEAAHLSGTLEAEYRKCQINTFGGGVAEVMRGLVAVFGLGLPHKRR